MYSAPDERSAAYIACGIAAESGEPVVLSCTGATASRNYMPGLTEAFYRHLPILAITSTQHTSRIGALIPQVLDRSVQPKDLVKLSVDIPTIHTDDDEWNAIVKINTAILELFHHGNGPVHINLATEYCMDYTQKELPIVRTIRRITHEDKFPDISNNKIGIFVGSHPVWTKDLTKAVDVFCEKYNAAVFCDHTSNYDGDYRVDFSLAFYQQTGWKEFIPSLLIHIGQVSGDYPSYKLGSTDQTKQVWRISPQGEICDTFHKLTYTFEMDEASFFNHYNQNDSNISFKKSYAFECRSYVSDLVQKIPDIPFSNIWIARQSAGIIPSNSVIHLGILNSLRSWNLFPFPNGTQEFSNTGGFGIDGILSSGLGGSLAPRDKLHFIIIGDLAFFYDMNVLGNRHISKNMRILLINNGCGTEFKNYINPGAAFGEKADDFIAAGGHYGRKSRQLVKHYAEDLGLIYLCAASKEDFKKHQGVFFNPVQSDKPILFEVFTNSNEESDAIKFISGLNNSMETMVKSVTKRVLGEKMTSCLRNVLK